MSLCEHFSSCQFIQVICQSFYLVNKGFSNAKGTVGSILVGFFGSAHIASLLLVSIYQMSSLKAAWLAYAGLSSVSLFRTFFFMPIGIFPSPIPDNYDMKITFDLCKIFSKEVRKYMSEQIL